ncbi:MAG: NfeD family protein [Ginsengibacter sp.]|jgi:membrane protein implicated in regulation of membrane protease activity
MDILLHTAVIWFIIGFILFILEFVVPGLILFFFAVGAWTVAILSIFVVIPLTGQLLIFVITSVLTIFILRKWLQKRLYGDQTSRQVLEDEFLGKFGIAETPITPGNNGKIDFKGTSWQAASADIISTGENVEIIGNDSILLIVKSTKPL